MSEPHGSALRLYLPKTNVNLCNFAPLLDSVKVSCLHVQNSRPLCVPQALLVKRKMHLTQFVCLTQPQPHSPQHAPAPRKTPPNLNPPAAAVGFAQGVLLSPRASSGSVQDDPAAPCPHPRAAELRAGLTTTQGGTRGEAGGINPPPPRIGNSLSQTMGSAKLSSGCEGGSASHGRLPKEAALWKAGAFPRLG